MPSPSIQPYPRLSNVSRKQDGLLDDSRLAVHVNAIDEGELKAVILAAIHEANLKSGREILQISESATSQELAVIYRNKGKELFDYFRNYIPDPASVSFQLAGKNARDVGKEHFRLKAIQMGRMNSGWRYQIIATDCASKTGRFTSVSDLGLAEADFNAVVPITETNRVSLNIYVSVKNRANTIGGPDWPGAIAKLEKIAMTDKNKRGPYLCVFAFVMERGTRSIKRDKDGTLRSPNTELWSSDFFWPFFTNLSYEEIMQAVLDALLSDPTLEQITPEAPDELLDIFEEYCRAYDLLDDDGNFADAKKLVKFFCIRDNRRLPRVRMGNIEEAPPTPIVGAMTITELEQQ